MERKTLRSIKPELFYKPEYDGTLFPQVKTEDPNVGKGKSKRLKDLIPEWMKAEKNVSRDDIHD